jgi:ankyrin repeat protein
MEQEETLVKIRDENLDRSAAEQNIACFSLATAMLEPSNEAADHTTPKRKSWTSDCTTVKTTHSEPDMETASRKILQAKRSSKQERDCLQTLDLTSVGSEGRRVGADCGMTEYTSFATVQQSLCEGNTTSHCAPDSNQTFCKIPTSPGPSTMLKKDVTAEAQVPVHSTPDELKEATESHRLQRVGAHIPTLDLGELSEKLKKLQIQSTQANKRRAHKQQQKHISHRVNGILENLSTEELSALFTNQDNDGDNLLMIAIIESCSVLADALIRLVPSPKLLNMRNKLGQTALHLTVITRQWRMVRWLVLAGADLEARDFLGNTALHVACGNSDLDCVISLTKIVTCLEVPEKSTRERLQVPQDSELYNFKGQTCLHIAAGNGFTLLVQYLLETRFRAEVNAAERLCGKTALHVAAELGNVDLVTYLLTLRDTEPDAVTYAGHSAVDLAAGRGQRRVVHLLERAGVKPQRTHDLADDNHSETDNNDCTDSEPEPQHTHNNHTKPQHKHENSHHVLDNHAEPDHNHFDNHPKMQLQEEDPDLLTLQDFECSVQASHRSAEAACHEALEYDDICIGGQPILSLQNSMYM